MGAGWRDIPLVSRVRYIQAGWLRELDWRVVITENGLEFKIIAKVLVGDAVKVFTHATMARINGEENPP